MKKILISTLLIGALLSPAAASAAVAPDTTGPVLGMEARLTKSSDSWASGSGYIGVGNYDSTNQAGWAINQGLRQTTVGNTIIVEGKIPYTTNYTWYEDGTATNSGWFIGFTALATSAAVYGSSATAHAVMRVDNNYDGYYDYTDDTLSTAASDYIIKVSDKTKNFTITLYYLKSGKTLTTTASTSTAHGTITEPSDAGDILAKQTYYFDLSRIEYLSAADTAKIKELKDAGEVFAGSLGSSITYPGNAAPAAAYIAKVRAARTQYELLADSTKSDIREQTAKLGAPSEIVTGTGNYSDMGKAYLAMTLAEKHIESYESLPGIGKLITALPKLEAGKDVDSETAAAISRISSSIAKLNDPAKTALLQRTNNPYTTPDALDNYTSLKSRMESTRLSGIITKLKSLPDLSSNFVDIQTVTSARQVWNEIETSIQRYLAGSTNALASDTVAWSRYTAYTNNFAAKLNAYAKTLWSQASKLSIEQPFTPEDRTCVESLRTVVENDYVSDIVTVTNLDWDTYDLLIEKLQTLEAAESDLSSADVAITNADSITFDGSPKTPDVTVTLNGKILETSQYNVAYESNTASGTAKVIVTASAGSKYTGKAEIQFTIKPATLTDNMIGDVSNVTYTGSARKPAVTGKAGVTFDVAYANNTAVGKATATVTGSGNYTGTVTKTFIITPAKAAITSVKGASKKLTVAYKAQKGAKYQILCKPTSGKSKTVTTSATKKTVTGLKAGTYKVYVKAYKSIDGKTYAGSYSAAKTVRVK